MDCHPARTTVSEAVRVSLLVCAILIAYWIFCALAYGQTKPKPEVPHVSCIITNHPYEVHDAQTNTTQEIEDWRVDCTITVGKKVVYGPKPLILPYPENYYDAAEAAREFIKTGAAEVLKQLKKEKGESKSEN